MNKKESNLTVPEKSGLPADAPGQSPRRGGILRRVEKVRHGADREKNRGFDTGYFLNSLTQILVIICCIGVTAFFAFHLIRGMTSGAVTMTARTVTETVTLSGQGVLLRREETVDTRMRGIPLYEVKDGEKVRSGKELCRVYPMADAGTTERIAALDAEIALLQAGVTEGTVSEGMEAAARRISESYREIMRNIADGSLAAASACADGLRTGLNRMAVLSGEGAPMAARLAALREERGRLADGLGEGIGSVSAEQTGYFFRACDGREAAFSALLDHSFGAAELRAALESAPEDVSASVGKLAADPVWYLAMTGSGADLDALEVGASYEITFPDNGGTVVPMKLERRSAPETEGEETLLLFSCNVHPEGFVWLRCQRAEVTVGSYTGCRVPISAVRSLDGMTGVYTEHGGKVLFRRIRVIYEGEGYYLAASDGADGAAEQTYSVLGFDPAVFPDALLPMERLAYRHALNKRTHPAGAVPVKYGYSKTHYYFLEEFETVIVEGEGLYHGKVLN